MIATGEQREPASGRCPICRKIGSWASGRYAPFCSERCKLVDLQRWFGGAYVISEPLRPEHVVEDGAIEDTGGITPPP